MMFMFVFFFFSSISRGSLGPFGALCVTSTVSTDKQWIFIVLVFDTGETRNLEFPFTCVEDEFF